jgi:hypothetical protein
VQAVPVLPDTVQMPHSSQNVNGKRKGQNDGKEEEMEGIYIPLVFTTCLSSVNKECIMAEILQLSQGEELLFMRWHKNWFSLAM